MCVCVFLFSKFVDNKHMVVDMKKGKNERERVKDAQFHNGCKTVITSLDCIICALFTFEAYFSCVSLVHGFLTVKLYI